MRVSTQTGVGLIEVMVAVLLLSVAVLGFSALQLRAISATDESLIRTQTLSIIRGLAENMRANAQEIDTYKETINDTTTSYVTCTGGCTAEEIAINEAKTAYDRLSSHGVTMSMVTCPGTANFSQVMCIIAAWGDTKAQLDRLPDPEVEEDEGDIDAQACANEDGIYKNGSTCIIVETY
jgi:type IV pilus assembly protein PilV